MSLDVFSMHALIKELSRALVGGRIDKITQPNKQTIVLSVRQPGRNYLLHITTNPANPAAHLLEKPLENPPEPPMQDKLDLCAAPLADILARVLEREKKSPNRQR